MGCKEDCCIGPIPFCWFLTPFYATCLPKSLIFQEWLIVETWNKCHWIQHAFNPNYMPLKLFQCIFPSQNQQNVKYLPAICDFSGMTYHRDLKYLCHWIQHAFKPYTICLSSHFNAFFQVKINKMWNFCLKLWFFRNYLSYRRETCTIGLGIPPTLNIHHSTHFNAFFLVKINKIWKFWLFA